MGLSKRLRWVGVSAVLIFSSVSWGWAEHHILTRQALKSLSSIQNLKVRPTAVSDMHRALGFASDLDMAQALQIRKDFRFLPHMGEDRGRDLDAAEILARYSDEPDWNMDKELFEIDQYPQLWKDEYQVMGGTKGTSSQAFRHMYWKGWTILNPLATFKLPLAKLSQPMGEAPARAALFVGLARKAFVVGLHYWGLRFLGNALHYIGDVSSPFHSTQSPTKKFILMPLTDGIINGGFDQYTKEVTNVIAYYHYSFEDYIGRQMTDFESGIIKPENKSLVDALTTGKAPYQYNGDAEALVKQVGELSVKQSPAAGRASLDFFPAIRVPLLQFDPKTYMDQAWWNETLLRGQGASAEKKAYYKVVTNMFGPLGQWVRDFVRYETRGLAPAAKLP